MSVPLWEVMRLNYDHHRRMGELHAQKVADGTQDASAAVDDLSYRELLMGIPPPVLVLELGSSAGGQWPLLRRLLRTGRIRGVDLYEPNVRAARQRGLSIRLGFAECLPYEDSTFDLVCSRHVMEHVGDVERAISEVHRVLVPGGWSAHATPDLGEDGEPSHLNRHGVEWWAKAWAEGGFEVIGARRCDFHGGEAHIVARKR
jgi:SAM-dependent methyltransferase